ncbi:MAG: ketosteroid isomerase-like protein [Yoonia sp.]
MLKRPPFGGRFAFVGGFTLRFQTEKTRNSAVNRYHMRIQFSINGGSRMAADNAKELIQLFSERFAKGDIDGLLELYEENALFPNHHTTARGSEQIRTALQGYIDSGAKIAFDRQVAFDTGDLALVQNAWTLTTVGGDKVNGVSVEVARKQADGRWKYVIDSPDGAGLLSD